MTDLLIFPFNGNGLEALDCLGDKHNFIGFIDDEKSKLNQTQYEVFDRSVLAKFPKAKILAVPGSPLTFRNRKNIIASLSISLDRYTTVIHPSAQIGKKAHIGTNSLIYANVVITSNAHIGHHVCILPNSVVHHDSSVGDYTLIGSCVCIAGHTKIGENCYVGSGSNIINGITIGNEVLIGMGSNVIQSFENQVKIVGNPAKMI